MFGFGWVRTHLGVVFGEAFRLFWSFGLISGKRDKIYKIRANFGVLLRGVGIPRSSVGPRRGVAKREVWKASGTPRRSYCSQRVDFCVLFCFAIPLFGGLVYWTNEDPISV